jgi:predicted aspartyl protease
MASNRIQIKRSTANATVTGLNAGELAFTANGNVLYIGNPANGASVRIGGLQSPGTLTPNQALVVNASSGIDKIIVANLVPTSIWANGGVGSAGFVLAVDGGGNSYWVSPSALASVNTAAQYSWTNTHTFNANVTVNGTLTTNGVLDVLSMNSATFTVGGFFAANSSGVYHSGGVNSAVLSVGSNFKANTTQVTLGANVKLAANGSLGTANQVLRTDTSGVPYWSDDTGDISSVTAGNGLSGDTTVGDVTIDVNAGDGISVNTSAVAVNAKNGLLANSSGLYVVGSNAITSNTSGVFFTTGSTLTVNSSGAHVNNNLSIQDLTLAGNLTINGTLTTVDTTNLVVNDSIISLARNNSADSLDIGFYGQYNDGTERFTGLVWDTSADTFELFANSTVEPTTTVDTGATGYVTASLKAFLQSGGLLTSSNSVTITANSTINVSVTANAVAITALANNDLVYANSSGGLVGLGLGTAGYVLQSNGSAITYDYLDGGTF